MFRRSRGRGSYPCSTSRDRLGRDPLSTPLERFSPMFRLGIYRFEGAAGEPGYEEIPYKGRLVELVVGRLVVQVSIGLSFGECPRCRESLTVVAVGRGYRVFGCPAHREYDRVVEDDP